MILINLTLLTYLFLHTQNFLNEESYQFPPHHQLFAVVVEQKKNKVLDWLSKKTPGCES